jgi:HEPN domain-containing protein
MSGIDLEYTNWLELAAHDLGSAEVLMKGTDYFDIVIYHVHQAVEKLLKAYLVKINGSYKRIHDLDKLHNECLIINSSFSEITNGVLFIHAFLGKVRYPFGDIIPKADALECLAYARKIEKFIQKAIK